MKKIPQDKANLLWDAIITYVMAEKYLESSKNSEPWSEGLNWCIEKQAVALEALKEQFFKSTGWKPFCEKGYEGCELEASWELK